jgi:polyphosphate glucokinase
MQDRYILGVDVGGSGIKGAVVDVETGELQTERLRIKTPQPATPTAMAEAFAELIKLHEYKGIIGCGFPAIIKDGKALTAANISPKWINKSVVETFSLASGCPVEALNDADAAGMAEMQFGLGKGHEGVVLLITIGSGLGSALFVDGRLVPNTEFGHMILHGEAAEVYASNKTRKNEDLSWKEWGNRFNEYLAYVERIVNPDIVLLGGGISKHFPKYESYLDVGLKVQPASLRNHAGTIGAALHARKQVRKRY